VEKQCTVHMCVDINSIDVFKRPLTITLEAAIFSQRGGGASLVV